MRTLVNPGLDTSACSWMLVQTRFISGEADSGMNSSGLRLSSCPGQILVVASNGVSGVCAAFFRFVRQENVAGMPLRLCGVDLPFVVMSLWRKMFLK